MTANAKLHGAMRTIGFILALAVGFACWGLTLALSGGVAPLGRVGPAEGIAFFTPIALFALPLAVLAFARGHALTGTWIGAIAPLLGVANFAFALSTIVSGPRPEGAVDLPPPTFALAWCGALAVALVAVEWNRRHSKASQRPDGEQG